MTDISNAITSFQNAKAGDVLDIGPGRYRYLLLSSAPTLKDGYWFVAGRRWMASRQTFAKTGLSFRVDGDAPANNPLIENLLVAFKAREEVETAIRIDDKFRDYGDGGSNKRLDAKLAKAEQDFHDAYAAIEDALAET